MSEENVRLVERIQALLAVDVVAELESDAPDVPERLAELVEPEFESTMIGPDYDSARFDGTGIDGFQEIWREWVSPFDSFEIEVEETIDAGERILSLVKLSGRTKTGGVEVEQPGAAVWTLRGGKLSRVEFHLDQDVARRAAGLDPQSSQE